MLDPSMPLRRNGNSSKTVINKHLHDSVAGQTLAALGTLEVALPGMHCPQMQLPKTRVTSNAFSQHHLHVGVGGKTSRCKIRGAIDLFLIEVQQSIGQ